jgi:hypothetical protein
MRVLIRLLAWIAAASTGLGAVPLWACPACFTSSAAGVRLGYYLSAAIMSLTPLLIMGLGIGYFALKSSRGGRAANKRDGQP